MTILLYDAHNHLQDERFSGRQDALRADARAVGVAAMVVNGSSEDDWDEVARLAALDATIIPSFGLHPWYHDQRTPRWLDRLTALMREIPRAAVGEIGLDRWKEDLPYEGQEEVFLAQWQLARSVNRPASIHCLKAWGRLHQLLREYPGPECGFILHSYGGPVEMVDIFARLGGYFSFPGYYLHARKEKQRELFRHVPIDRLLIETDAPDQPLPAEHNRYPLNDSEGHAINHPANLAAVHDGLAEALGMSGAELAGQVEHNFLRLFGFSPPGPPAH